MTPQGAGMGENFGNHGLIASRGIEI